MLARHAIHAATHHRRGRACCGTLGARLVVLAGARWRGEPARPGIFAGEVTASELHGVPAGVLVVKTVGRRGVSEKSLGAGK
jgi:hypothetical protein